MIDDLQVPGQKLLHHGHRPPNNKYFHFIQIFLLHSNKQKWKELLLCGRKEPKQSTTVPLQRLGQDGVVGVSAALGGDGPGLLPAQTLLVQQDPHQLRH